VAGPLAAGARWAFLTGLTTRFAPTVFTVVLARILTPADFGLVAVAMVVVAFVGLFQDLGLKQALVQRREVDARLTGAVFWGGIGVGVVWFVAIFLSAPLFGRLYRSPEVVPVLRSLGALFLITPLGLVPEALLLRDLRFRRLFALELLPSIVPGVVAIGLAGLGLGVWALVWGTLAGSALRTGTLWALVPWRPGRPARFGAWRQLMRFGGWVSLEAILGWMIANLDQAFAGRFLGAAGAGVFRMGVALALFPATGVSQTVGRVLFPAYSRLQDEPDRIREGLERCIRLVAIVSVPVGVAAVAYADPVVPVLLGEHWRPAVDVIRILAPAGVLASLVGVAPPLYRAVGRVDILPKFFLVRALVSVPVYWWSAQGGLIPLVMAKLLLTCGFAPVNLWIAVRVFGARIGGVAASVAMPCVAAAVALAGARGLGAALAGALPRAAVPVELVAFAAAYPAVLALVSAACRKELTWLARNLLGRG